MIIRSLTDTGKEVWLNTKTQTMIEIPKEVGFLGKNGVTYPVFDRIESFIESGKKECIIHAYCNSKTKKGKRYLYNIELPFGNYDFFNCEHTSIGWINHEIKEMHPNNAYRILLKQNKRCINDVEIIYIKPLNR